MARLNAQEYEVLQKDYGQLNPQQQQVAKQLMDEYEVESRIANNSSSDYYEEQGRQRGALIRGAAVGAAGGIAEAGYQGIANVADLFGAERVSNWARTKQTDMRTATQEIAKYFVTEATGEGDPAKVQEAAAKYVDAAAKGGKLAGQAAVAFSPGGWAKGLASGLTFGAAEGFVFGALQAETDKTPEGERRAEIMKQAQLGAALGGIFGVGSGLYGSVRNWFAGKVKKYATDSATAKAVADEFGVSLTFGQQTGSPIVRKIEFDAAGDQATLFYKDQADKLVSAIAGRTGVTGINVLGTQLGASMNAQKQAIIDGAKNVVNVLTRSRAQQWKANLAEATKLSGGGHVAKPNSLLATMNEIEKDALNDMGYMFEMSGAWKTMRSKVEEAAERGGATVQELDEWWRNINTWKKHGSGIVRPSTNLKGDVDIAEAKRLLESGAFGSKGQAFAYTLSGSFDNVLMNGALPGQEAAVSALVNMRNQYKAASGVIRQINDQVLDGVGLAGKPPEQALMAFGKADIDVQRRIVQMLRGQEGGEIVIQSIRDAMYESAVQQASKAAALKGQVTGAIDVQTLVDGLAANNNRSMLAGVITREEEEYARKGIQLIRHILNADPMYAATGALKTTLPMDLTGLAINAVSRDPGFVARLLANSIQRGSTFEQLFFTKKGIEALNSLKPEFVRTDRLARARNATIMGLATFVGGDSITKTKDRVDAEMTQGQQNVGP